MSAVREPQEARAALSAAPLSPMGAVRAAGRRRGWLVKRLLVVADAVGLLVAFGIAQWQFGTPAERLDHVGPAAELGLFILTLPAWVVVAKIYRLYERDEEAPGHSTADDVLGVFHLVTSGCWLFFSLGWVSGLAQPTVTKVFAFWALAIPAVTLARVGARSLARRHESFVQNAVIIGAGAVGQTVARKLLQHPEYRINLLGFVDPAPRERRPDLGELTILGGPDDLPRLVDELEVERLIVAFSGEPDEEVLGILKSLDDRWLQIDIVPRFYELVAPGIGVHTFEGLPVVGLQPFRLPASSRFLKRTVDVTVSLAGLTLLAPVLAVMALAIKLDSRGPVVFSQRRVGLRGRPFELLKLRTMAAGADEQKPDVQHLNQHLRPGGDPRMFKIAHDPRVTRVGRFLRRYSLDELPQLVNVLRGEMSLVGPRPLILDEARHVGDWARRRLDLKPGMTGLWQVVGRSSVSFDEMVRLDYLYVMSWSLRNDLLLLLRTAPVVLRGNAP